MKQKRISSGFVLRTEKKCLDEKPGIYFDYVFNIHAIRRIPDKQVEEIRDFLSRYLNRHDDIAELCKEGRAKAHAILRGLNRVESIFGEFE